MKFSLCALIPTYNHHFRLPEIVKRLHLNGLSVLIVDDGSGPATQAILSRMKDAQILHLPVNCGKGAALEAGFKRAAELGFTHTLQIDADGQHSLDDLDAFIELSKNNPEALVSGKPVYDSSIPWSRKIGRWITHVWVWIETLSFAITDSMCGFRIYPLKASLAVIQQSHIGKRMDFDTEIMVRMFWEGTPVLMHPVRVTYPEGNLSNFNVLQDNWRLIKMHTRLVCGMLARLPVLLFRKRKMNWSELSERGTHLGIFLLGMCNRVLGRTVCTLIGAPVVLYFYLTGSQQRKASAEFLARVFKIKGLQRSPSFVDQLKHYMHFFQMLVDKFAAWSGSLSLDNIEFNDSGQVRKAMSDLKGGVLLVSHLGNMDICRALMNDDQKQRMHILLHSKNARQLNRAVSYFNPQSNLNIIEVTEIGPDTILFLKDRIEKGDWAVIAADRTPVSEKPRVTFVPFLEDKAPFSQGPYILASLLQCPVYTAMAVYERSKYKAFFELFAEKIILLKGRKEACINEYARQYARHLESYAIAYPYQWFNFFDFWHVNAHQVGWLSK